MFIATPQAKVGIATHLIAKMLLLRKSTRRTVVRYLFSRDENLGAVVEPQGSLIEDLKRVGHAAIHFFNCNDR
jgi:hypothetical protein